MEMTMTNGFMELNQNEMEMVEGGKGILKEAIEFAVVTLTFTYAAGHAVGEAIYNVSH